MNALDAYYTPAWVADLVAASLPRHVSGVVDVAAGRGALLEAVSRAHPAADIFAMDIDRSATDFLRARHGGWTVAKGDATRRRSLSATRVWRERGTIDAAVLNPPFSFRGGRRVRTAYQNAQYRLTPASSFVATALDVVGLGGSLVAVLPANTLHNSGDSQFWSEVRENYEVVSVLALGSSVFPGARTKTVVISVQPIADSSFNVQTPDKPRRLTSAPSCLCIDVIRGRVQMHSLVAKDSGAELVHTRHLRNSSVLASGVFLDPDLASTRVVGLIPRVGKPDPTKIAFLPAGKDIVLSDCVFGFRAIDLRSAAMLKAMVESRFESIRDLYQGSCAPYLTVARLVRFLADLGFNPRHVPASGSAQPCSCRAETTVPVASVVGAG